MATEEQNTAKPSPSLRDLILEKLHEKGVATVTIEFDGACDEGQVESITCTTSGGGQGSLDWPCEIPGKLMALGPPSALNVGGQTKGPIASRPMTMKELVEEWTYDLLDDVGIDWVNNDGGYGEITIDVNEGSIGCEMNERFMDALQTHHEL